MTKTHIQVFPFLFVYFATLNLKKVIKYTAMLSIFPLWIKASFIVSDTRPTQVGEMDLCPVP